MDFETLLFSADGQNTMMGTLENIFQLPSSKSFNLFLVFVICCLKTCLKVYRIVMVEYNSYNIFCLLKQQIKNVIIALLNDSFKVELK